MEISKSTPYVRYRENISSTLHKGTIHIESEYLDRERKTTIESIEGQTWQNMVNGENKEEDILPRLGLKIEGNEDVLDSKEQHMPIDTIIGDVESVANEDGTYTYEISTMEGSYAKTLDGENNFSLTSDGLVGDMYIKYNAQGEEVNGNIVMNNQSSYTIENSNNGEIKSAILKGSTKYRDIDTGDILDTFDETKNLELVSVKMPVLTTTGKNLFDGKLEYGLLNANNGLPFDSNDYVRSQNFIPINCETITFTVINGECGLSFYYYDKDKNFISSKTKIKVSDDLSIPDGVAYLKFRTYPISDESITNNLNTQIQIEEGKVATEYEPYKSNILTINEDVTLCGIGDVQDKLDCLTGEVTESIGEIVLDGTQYMASDGYGVYIQVNDVKRFLDYTDKIACDKLPVIPTYQELENVENGISGFSNSGSYLGQNWLYVKINNSVNTDEVKEWLTQKPITIQYQLSKESIKTVDLTIKDQDDKIIQSLHTHPSTTHVNLSSDGLIPSAELSYTMYGNIGETTGEQITDGTDSKLIEGKVYGDTLQNVLPSPSLKNSMDYNTSMQKLNNGYGNINVVDGEFKKANLYGQTLVNIFDNWKSKTGSLTPTPTQDGYFLFTGNNLNARVDLNNISMFKRDVEYTFICRIKNSTYDGENGNLLRLQIGANIIIYSHEIVNGIWKIKKSFATDESNCNVGVLSWAGSTGSAEVSLQIIEGDYTNDDISYFEGMQSVKMPSLTTRNKQTFVDFKEVSRGEGDFVVNSSSNGREVYITTPHWQSLNYVFDYEDGQSYTIKLDYEAGNYVIDFYSVEGRRRYGITGTGTIELDFIPQLTGGRLIEIVNNVNGGSLKLSNVEFGLTSKKNEPYKSNTLSTPEDVILREIGDVRDELDCLTGELTQRIGEIVLNGSEDGWVYGGRGSTTAICYIEKYFTTPPTNVITNYFSSIENRPDVFWNEGQDCEMFCVNDTSLAFKIERTKLKTLDSNGIKEWLSQNNLIIQYDLATPVIKTVDLTITNQDNQPQTTLHSIANGYINVTSQGSLPKVTYEVPTSNSYYLDTMVKPNTQYTTKSSSDCNATIDGTSYPLSANGTFTTPSTITDKLMVLDAPVNDLMFIEGDLTSRKLLYFEGLTSVENPLVVVGGKNLFDVNTISLDSSKWSNFSDAYANMNTPFMRLKPNTIYQMYGTITQKPNTYNLFKFQDKNGKEINGTYTTLNNNNNNSSRDFTVNTRFTTPEDGAVYLVTFPAYNDLNNIKWLKEMLEKSSLMIEEGEKTSYEKPVHVHLTTNKPITLHKIGDIKDELDLVNECVVRHIGKIVLDGSDDEVWEKNPNNDGDNTVVFYIGNIFGQQSTVIIDKFIPYVGESFWTKQHNDSENHLSDTADLAIRISKTRLSSVDIDGFKQWLSKNPITVIYELATPVTEPVRIVPQNHRQSTTSLTLQSPLQKVGNVSDQLRWNPYKGHYVRYNYIQDGVANSTYTFEDLKDMNERKYVNLYNQRTYIDTDHTVQVISHGLSRYCLAEQGKQYQVRWDWVEQPSVDTIKVDLCGNVKEIPSSDNSIIIDVEKFTHQFIQIQGLGLTGKITNLMVIETIDGEIPDVDFFSGIQCVGNTVTIDGNTKVQIDMEQTNGNLIDIIPKFYNNGNNLQFNNISVKHNRQYHISNEPDSRGMDNFSVHFLKEVNGSTQSNITFYGSGVFDVPFGCKYITIYRQTSEKGNANIYHKIDLHYADMAKDGIRPRYYDKESIILPMKLCRVGNIYDNLYYDDLKGYYRIQQSIGHKYFTGETTEVWTMETTNGYRTIKFTCTSANIDQIALGQTICNSFKHLSTINDDIEGFIIYNGNFVLRVDKDRLTDKTVDGFKALLASSPIHLFYQLKTPQMINLTEYPNRIELNTYRDEIFTFFKGMNPTKFTLSVPMDKTYRYEIAEEGQGLANRVAVNNETISAENVVAVKEVRGQGIANIIEDVDNVVITPRPNHSGIATSHTLNNTKPATIRVHGFEASGETTVANYNVTDKAYQLKVMSSNGDNSLSDYYVLNVPYKLETYADGTKDMVYYDEEYKQWHFKGSSVKEYTAASDGTLDEIIEIFRGLAPRSGMIAEFKLMFTSGTTAARMYYSLNGTTYSYTSLKRMTDGNYLYVGIFNTGGTKIDIAYKTDPNEEYTNLSPLSTQVPECFMINQITSCTFCELTLDKQYIYSEMNSPIELDTYDGTTKVFMDGNATDTNIIIRNDATTKIVNTYTDTEYTVYWKYVDGLGNLRITLGGTTVEVDGKQEYATLKTQLNTPQELLYVGGYNLSIKDLMVVKGAKINDLPYFEGSRQVGTLVLDEEGNKSYKITLVQGGSVLEQRDEDAIAFKDDNKHNVVVHKIVGVCPTKVD